MNVLNNNSNGEDDSKKGCSEIVDVNHSYIVDEYEDLIDNTF